MVTARPINVERALVDPRAVFKDPIEVLAWRISMPPARVSSSSAWRQDALELQAPADEAMSGGEEPMLKRVLDAIRTLGARQTDAQPLAR
jgi:hypothetical protein